MSLMSLGWMFIVSELAYRLVLKVVYELEGDLARRATTVYKVAERTALALVECVC